MLRSTRSPSTRHAAATALAAFALAAAAGATPRQAPQRAAVIESVALIDTTPAARLEIVLDRPLVWSVGRDADGHLALDLPNARPGHGAVSRVFPAGLVAELRLASVGLPSRPITRVVVVTRGAADHRLAVDGARLRIELVPTGLAFPGPTSPAPDVEPATPLIGPTLAADPSTASASGAGGAPRVEELELPASHPPSPGVGERPAGETETARSGVESAEAVSPPPLVAAPPALPTREVAPLSETPPAPPAQATVPAAEPRLRLLPPVVEPADELPALTAPRSAPAPIESREPLAPIVVAEPPAAVTPAAELPLLAAPAPRAPAPIEPEAPLAPVVVREPPPIAAAELERLAVEPTAQPDALPRAAVAPAQRIAILEPPPLPERDVEPLAPPDRATPRELPASPSAALDVAAVPPPPRPLREAATELLSITRLAAGVLAVAGDGGFDFTGFRLENPERFVLDLHGVINHSAAGVVEIDEGLLVRVRISQYRSQPVPITRVIFDLRAPTVPAIEPAADGLLVRFPLTAAGPGGALPD